MALPALRSRLRVLTCAALAIGAVGVGAPASADPVEEYPIPASGTLNMQGAGWGHGRGLSQWGAYQAASIGVAHPEILAFYYPGTTLAVLPAAPVRVLLSADRGRDLLVRAVTGLSATFDRSGAQTLVLPDQPAGCRSPATRWRARTVRSGMRIDARCGGRWRTVVRSLTGPTVSFEVPDGMVVTLNGSARRGYRGSVSATRLSRRSVQVVNTLPMEEYLRPVVAAEVPSSWPVEALRAQAIAARSFAAREVLGAVDRPFDVYDSTRSQAYPGAVWFDSSGRVVGNREYASTDAAILDTAGVQATVGGVPALTQFSSSNGGVSAASPLPHMVSQVDPWDAAATRNPRLAWTASVSAAALRSRCRGAGRIAVVRVLSREGVGPWGGRVSGLEVVGSGRSCRLTTDSAIRAMLGVNSSLLTFTP